VRVFARGCETAALLVNGHHLATAPVQPNLTAVFPSIPYTAGTLQALCVNGTAALPNVSAVLRTAGAPVALRLTADRDVIHAAPSDLSYVTVSIVDAAGLTVPDAQLDVSVTVSEGADVGHIIGIGSGDPSDPASFTSATRTTWRGNVVAVVQPQGQVAGKIVLLASAPGLTAARLLITARPRV